MIKKIKSDNATIDGQQDNAFMDGQQQDNDRKIISDSKIKYDGKVRYDMIRW